MSDNRPALRLTLWQNEVQDPIPETILCHRAPGEQTDRKAEPVGRLGNAWPIIGDGHLETMIVHVYGYVNGSCRRRIFVGVGK